MRTHIVVLVAVALLAATALAALPPDESRSVQTGVYTAEQSQRGAKVFEVTCQSCHQPEEFGDGFYLEGWSGQKLSDLVGLVRETMPQDSPGSLKREEYLDVTAYFLEMNGVPAGDTEMDDESVKLIVIEGPFGPKQDR